MAHPAGQQILPDPLLPTHERLNGAPVSHSSSVIMGAPGSGGSHRGAHKMSYPHFSKSLWSQITPLLQNQSRTIKVKLNTSVLSGQRIIKIYSTFSELSQYLMIIRRMRAVIVLYTTRSHSKYRTTILNRRLLQTFLSTFPRTSASQLLTKKRDTLRTRHSLLKEDHAYASLLHLNP